MIMKNVLLTIFLLTELLALKSWLGCVNIQDKFHLSFANLRLQTNESISNDKGLPQIIGRFFHNKVTDGFFEFFRAFFSYWEPAFLINLLSFIGFIGILFGFYYLFKGKKHFIVIAAIIFLLGYITFEILFNFNSYFMLKLFILAIPYYIISFFGISQFIRYNRTYWALVILTIFIIISIVWIAAFQHTVYNLCIKI